MKEHGKTKEAKKNRQMNKYRQRMHFEAQRREEKETVKRTQREFIHYAERKFLQRS